MANGTIAFDTLQTSGQIQGTAKSVDTDYLVSGIAKIFAKVTQDSTHTINSSFNIIVMCTMSRITCITHVICKVYGT